jgi:plastocyanin
MRIPVRAVTTGVTALLVTLALSGCNSSDPVGNVAAGPATGAAVKIQAVDGEAYTPATLRLPAGKQTTVEITNASDSPHDFAIEAAGLNTGTIEPGKTATATLTITEATRFKCTYHNNMGGTIEPVSQEG